MTCSSFDFLRLTFAAEVGGSFGADALRLAMRFFLDFWLLADAKRRHRLVVVLAAGFCVVDVASAWRLAVLGTNSAAAPCFVRSLFSGAYLLPAVALSVGDLLLAALATLSSAAQWMPPTL